jgi:hypothetical protein
MPRALFPLLCLLLPVFWPSHAFAQINLQEGKEGEVLSAPICGKLINRSDQTIMGTLMTAAQLAPSGDMVKHRDNFTLEAGKEREFCAAGPFYEGRRVELTLRTVIPLFSCKTKLDAPIYLDAKEDENGIKKLSATCS